MIVGRRGLTLFLLAMLALSACTSSDSNESSAAEDAASKPVDTPIISTYPDAAGAIGLTNTSSWVYWLSDVDLDAIAAAAPAVAVIDYSADGSSDTAFAAADIDRLRAAMSSPAKVIAYMSIGEAEDYRFYWEPGWREGSPGWITAVNPDWEGNFKVEYWNSQWQATIFGSPDSYLGQIVAAGFDGVYLDIVDAYEFYEDEGVDDARERMIEFVVGLGAWAREQSPGFLIVPQNAPELGADAAYLDLVDGIGMESVYFGYDETGVTTDPDVTEELEAQLKRFTDAGKFVLAVDYVDAPSGVASAYQRGRLQGFLPTVTDVDLDRLPIAEPGR